MAKRTPLKAIRAKCLDCVCGQLLEINKCHIKECPLWEYRRGKRPKGDDLLTEDAEFRAFVIDYLLGEDWHVIDPLGQTQVNEIALADILSKYSKRFKKEIKPLRSIRRWE